MKPALLIQPSNVKLLKLKKSDRKGAEFMLQNSMHMIRVRITDLTQQSAVSSQQSASLLWCDFFRAIGCRWCRLPKRAYLQSF